MKYFSHLCTAQDDEKFDLLFETYSFEGYGVYWWLCEHVGRRKKTANDSPAFLFSTPTAASRVMERGARRTRILTIIKFLHQIRLIEMEDKGDWISIKIPKLNNYSAEWQKRLAKKNYGAAPEGTPESLPSGLGREVVDVKSLRREEKRSKESRLGTDGPDAPPEQQPDDETTRAEGLKMIREASEAIGKIGGNGPQQASRRVVESQEALPIVETPEGMEDETIEKERQLQDLGIAIEKVSVIINAWLCIKTEKFDQYALADALNNLGIMGLDRSKVYQVLGVV